jgi:hypothetical protein
MDELPIPLAALGKMRALKAAIDAQGRELDALATGLLVGLGADIETEAWHADLTAGVLRRVGEVAERPEEP